MKQSKRLLTRGDVLEVCRPTGLTTKELEIWLDRDYVTPVSGGHGQGSHRLFSVEQTVAIAIAATIRHSKRGCVIEYVETLIRAFEKVPATVFEGWFAEGRTAYGRIHQERVMLDAHLYDDSIDVEQVFRATMKRIERAERVLKDRGGRLRGLDSRRG